jgi:hypothetical protein
LCYSTGGSVHTKLSSLLVVGCFVTLGVGCLPGIAEAGLVTFEYNQVYSGAEPRGDGPWLRATFSDGTEADEVRLVLEAGGLSGREFVSTWLFNLAPDLDPDDLSIVRVGGLSPSRIRTGENDFNRGGARFDVLISYPTRNGPRRFDEDDYSEFLITWRAGAPALPLTPESFDFTSPGRREFEERTWMHTRTRSLYTAAHIQDIRRCDDDDSGWVTADPALQPPDEPIPEPGTLLLVGSGVLGLAGVRRRRRGPTAARSRTS